MIGGSGFLGSHVADYLTDAGYRVVVFDRGNSPYLQKNQEMIECYILDQEMVLQVVSEVDAVFHFAGLADIEKTNQKPLETVKYNILGTTNLLDSCLRKSRSDEICICQ